MMDPASSTAVSTTSTKKKSHNNDTLDYSGSPSSEISEDMAPVGHYPETAEQKIKERSKYEAAEPYRSRKGDRFS